MFSTSALGRLRAAGFQDPLRMPGRRSTAATLRPRRCWIDGGVDAEPSAMVAAGARGPRAAGVGLAQFAMRAAASTGSRSARAAACGTLRKPTPGAATMASSFTATSGGAACVARYHGSRAPPGTATWAGVGAGSE